MSFHRITLKINGSMEQLDVPGHMTLLQLLRDKVGLTGTKNGCASGECGACTVLLNGDAVNSCMVLAAECNGAEVVTIEGLAKKDELDTLQTLIVEEGGVQCGFCTPGILISARALLNRNPNPSEFEIRDAISGNLCRCTGYNRIVSAISKAANVERNAAEQPSI